MSPDPFCSRPGKEWSDDLGLGVGENLLSLGDVPGDHILAELDAAAL
jgi:hypothetical protein